MSYVLDVRGLACPLPVIRAEKAIAEIPHGAVLTVHASDPMAKIDIPHFCAEAGHELVALEEEGGGLTFTIRRS